MDNNKKIPISELAYQWIKDAIVACELKPGQLIVQGDLADQYNIGITPVREALRQLSQEGFVQAVPRLGYQVSQITNQDVEEIFEMRLILESQSARMTAIRAPMDVIKSICNQADFTYTYKKKESYLEFLHGNALFHSTIAAASGNQRLAEQVLRILDELNRVFHLGLDVRDSAEEMRNDHLKLAKALMSRDPDMAEEIVRDEIQRSHIRVKEAIQHYQNQNSATVFIHPVPNF